MRTERSTPSSDIAAPEEEAGAGLQRAILHSIEQLPEDYTHTLRELEGMSYDEIAVAMNCPIGTVRFEYSGQIREISQKFPGTFSL